MNTNQAMHAFAAAFEKAVSDQIEKVISTFESIDKEVVETARQFHTEHCVKHTSMCESLFIMTFQEATHAGYLMHLKDRQMKKGK